MPSDKFYGSDCITRKKCIGVLESFAVEGDIAILTIQDGKQYGCYCSASPFRHDKGKITSLLGKRITVSYQFDYGNPHEDVLSVSNPQEYMAGDHVRLDYHVTIAGDLDFDSHRIFMDKLDMALSNKSRTHKVKLMLRGADIKNHIKKYVEARQRDQKAIAVVGYKAGQSDATIAFRGEKTKTADHFIEIAQLKNKPVLIVNY